MFYILSSKGLYNEVVNGICSHEIIRNVLSFGALKILLPKSLQYRFPLKDRRNTYMLVSFYVVFFRDCGIDRKVEVVPLQLRRSL